MGNYEKIKKIGANERYGQSYFNTKTIIFHYFPAF